MEITTDQFDLNKSEVQKDIDLILWSTKLADLYRFTHQRFWENETLQNEYALRIEAVDNKGNKTPRAESVAEHSWHIADIILIIGPRFSDLNLERCLFQAILHDKLEIITGDKNPIGRNGKGTNTHAFNKLKKKNKDLMERDALDKYLGKLNTKAHDLHKKILIDTIELESIESRFVKAIDKIHPLTYIIRKKKGDMLDDHISFTLKYSSTYSKYYPQLKPYYNELIDRLFIEISLVRKCSPDALKNQFYTTQLELF